MLAKSSIASSQRRTGDLCEYERIVEKEKQILLVVDDQLLVTTNWSVNDCLVDGLQGWKKGDTVTAALETLQGVPIGAIISKIARIDDQGRAALCFTTVATFGEGFPK
jgi:hypothetical protein|tara:strand:- start:801 stop:1124 length:324 start_codon:yes stop_codon:yes gene_type:complete